MHDQLWLLEELVDTTNYSIVTHRQCQLQPTRYAGGALWFAQLTDALMQSCPVLPATGAAKHATSPPVSSLLIYGSPFPGIHDRPQPTVNLDMMMIMCTCV